jgi:hypothetical protein
VWRTTRPAGATLLAGNRPTDTSCHPPVAATAGCYARPTGADAAKSPAPGKTNVNSSHTTAGRARTLGSVFARLVNAIPDFDTPRPRHPLAACFAAGFLLAALPALAGDRLIATGGVSQVEGAAGGGLSPWALIAGTGTADQIGAIAHLTDLRTGGGFTLRAGGVAVGAYNRVEVSLSSLRFGLSDTVPGRSIRVDTLGLKLRVAGDAVYDQDRWLPQIAVGAQFKRNRDYDLVPRALGAASASGTDLYVSASKLWLAGLAGRNVFANLTLRASAANQFGILGFGGPLGSSRRIRPEAAVALFVTDTVAVGAEVRAKNNNLAAFREERASDLFVAWFPSKHFSLTLARVDLGNIANKPDQRGWYVSAQVAF